MKIMNLSLNFVYSYFVSLLLVLLSFQNGKTQNFHIPENGLNTIFVKQKYNLKFLLHGKSSTRDQEHHPKMQLAFSPLKNISVALGFFKLKEEDLSALGPRGFKGRTFSSNIGAYKKINLNPIKSEKYLFVTFTLGISNSDIEAYTIQYDSRFKSRKYFAQLSFGHHFKRWSWDLFFKYNRLNYISGTVNFDVLQINDSEIFEAIESEPFFNTMEYKGQLTIGEGFFQLMTGFSYEVPLDKSERFFFLEGGGIYFGGSINFNKFATVVKKNQKKYIDY